MTDNTETSRLVSEARELWAQGRSPSEVLRHFQARGQRGVQLIVLIQDAFGIQLSKTNAITAWMADGDDARLDRFLVRHMPGRDLDT